MVVAVLLQVLKEQVGNQMVELASRCSGAARVAAGRGILPQQSVTLEIVHRLKHGVQA